MCHLDCDGAHGGSGAELEDGRHSVLVGGEGVALVVHHGRPAGEGRRGLAAQQVRDQLGGRQGFEARLDGEDQLDGAAFTVNLEHFGDLVASDCVRAHFLPRAAPVGPAGRPQPQDGPFPACDPSARLPRYTPYG